MLTYSRRALAAKTYVDPIRAATVCEHCGAQPIEWHNPEHVLHPVDRIGSMIGRGRPVAMIQAEIDRCMALCRRCHMAEDGRMERFAEQASRPKKVQPPKPCRGCGRMAKPLRRELCSRCYDRERRPAARRAIPHICAACGRDYRPLRKGLCSRCYERGRKQSHP